MVFLVNNNKIKQVIKVQKNQYLHSLIHLVLLFKTSITEDKCMLTLMKHLLTETLHK